MAITKTISVTNEVAEILDNLPKGEKSAFVCKAVVAYFNKGGKNHEKE